MALNVGKEITALRRMTVPDLRRKCAEVFGESTTSRQPAVPGCSERLSLHGSHAGSGRSVPDTAWSLFNAFTEVAKSRSPRVQMESGLRLSSTFRSALAL